MTIKKPTKKFWIKSVFAILIFAFLTYIIFRLVQVEKEVQPQFDHYEFSESKNLSDYVLENDFLRFEINPKNTTFTVLQKQTGKIWYSNPKDAMQDKLALTKEKNLMMSPVLLKYSTQNGTDDIYDVYSNSVLRKFYNIERRGNEIVVNYTVGQMDREYIFPLVLYQSELDKWEQGLSKSQKNAIERAYHKYNKNSFKGSELSQMLEKYPGMQNENLYLIFENVQTHVKVQLEELFSKLGFTYNDYQKNKEAYKESNIKEVPAFNISLIYKIEENNLTVKIPFNEISYRLKFPLTQISVLPYFGAAGLEDKGYMLVPEGSGSIINFNNGKTKQNGYYADCYGWDYATERKAVITETRAAFAAFGIAYSDSSALCVIKKGAEYAGITAEIAGKLGSYNYVRADYKMLHREQYEVTARSQNAQFIYEANLPKDEYIEQSFTFINSSSYVEMAKVYRKSILPESEIQAKNLENQKPQSQVPLAVELVGAIEKTQQVAGIPKIKPYKLTSYREAENIINQIEELGVKNVNYKLSGFINGGVRQTIMKKLKFLPVLGGKSDFKKLVKNTGKTSAKLYLNAAVQTAWRSDFFDGFYKYRDSARFVTDQLCRLYEYTPIWYGKTDEHGYYYLLSSKLRKNTCKVFNKAAKKYKLGGVSFYDNGNLLSSDFNKKNRSSRANEMQNQFEQLESAKNQNLSVMINGGNSYAISNSDFIVNLTLHGNSYAILDEFVPFYEIALHGFVNYAASPVNLAYEKQQLLLESAEAGAGLQFLFMNAAANELVETYYSEYFASNFDSAKNQFVQLYNDYNSKMAVVMNSPIKNHQILEKNVTETEFENGWKVFVNFGYEDFTTSFGKKVLARDFCVFKAVE